MSRHEGEGVLHHEGEGDEGGSAHLDLNSSRVHRNGGMGIVMYGGSGNIVEN